MPEVQANAATTSVPSYGVDTNWYLDTGATDHVTGELEKLTVRDRYTGDEQVHTASGQGMAIQHIGHTQFHTSDRPIHLNHILHVPQASKSLVSASKLGIDNNAYVEVHPQFFCVKDQATGKILLHGKSRGGLYPFRSVSQEESKQVLSASKPSSTRWHRRLGHPSFPIVHQVLKNNSLPFTNKHDEPICDACQKGKSHQLPYPNSTSESHAPLELIYSDVWGPGPVSVGRYKYYVSFIDDYSKFTWIYLLKNKSDVFQKFHDFQNLVERMFNKKILSIQSDWGGEYRKLNSFFERIGISHHVSCPYAHQQNGSAERKHRHIVEIGLCLLAHASMPLKFWDEAFTTAAYLINRLPSKVIHFQTPMEKLFHTKPNYSFLWIFGCAVWPNLRPYNQHKLQFRSKQCAFIGYSGLHKGYKCLDISTGRVYISRDVVFDESVFPFANLHPNAGAQLRAELLLLPSVLRNPSNSDQEGDLRHDFVSVSANFSDENSMQEPCVTGNPGASFHADSRAPSAGATAESSGSAWPDSAGESVQDQETVPAYPSASRRQPNEQAPRRAAPSFARTDAPSSPASSSAWAGPWTPLGALPLERVNRPAGAVSPGGGASAGYEEASGSSLVSTPALDPASSGVSTAAAGNL